MPAMSAVDLHHSSVTREARHLLMRLRFLVVLKHISAANAITKFKQSGRDNVSCLKRRLVSDFDLR